LGVARGAIISSPYKTACYEILRRVSDLDVFFETTQGTENDYDLREIGWEGVVWGSG